MMMAIKPRRDPIERLFSFPRAGANLKAGQSIGRLKRKGMRLCRGRKSRDEVVPR
jgi:hypothetical protein